MMTVINTNTAAINAQYNLSKVQSSMDDAMAALSSGKRITSAADDAAGLSIVTRMESQVRGLNQAMRNAADGQSIVDTAEGSMDEISNMLQRMRELALQAANGSNNLEDRTNLNAEVDQLKAEIDRIVDTTQFNGQNLLDGSFSGSLQVGANAGETIGVNVGNMGTSALGSVSGAVTSGSVRSAEFSSVSEHKDTVAQMTFNGNDTYDFDLTIDGTEVNIRNAVIVNNSAEGVVDAINEALAAEGKSNVTHATSSGNVVTLTNEIGTDISVANFSADANSTATYISLAGKDASDLQAGESLDSVTLGGNNSAVGNSFMVGSGEVYSSTGTAATISATQETVVIKFDPEDLTAEAINTLVVAGVDYETADASGTSAALSDTPTIEGFVNAVTNGTAYKGQSDFTVEANAQGDAIIVKFAAGAQDTTPTVTLEDGESDPAEIVPSFTSRTKGYDEGGLTTASAETASVVFEGFASATAFEDAAYTMTIGGVELTTSNGDGTAESIATDATLAAFVTALQNDSNYDDAGFTIEADTDNDAIVVTWDDAGAMADVGITLTQGTSDTGVAKISHDVVQGADISTASTDTNSDTPTGGSRLYLDMVGADKYSFDLNAGGATIKSFVDLTYDGTENGLSAVATEIGSQLSTDDWLVSSSDGQIEIIRKNGQAFDIDNFNVDGGGRMVASTNLATSGDGSTKLLEENSAVQTATTTGVGDVTDTVVTLSVSSMTDAYSFTISDGEATARVDANLGSSETLVGAINYALAQSGMGGLDADGVATTTGMYAVEDVPGKVTLIQTSGKSISIDDFKSDGQGTMTAVKSNLEDDRVIDSDAAAMAKGFDRVLDDGDGASGTAVSSIDISTTSGASSALAVIDAALQDINTQRGELGAVSNRLDHTISNLGNIVVNTEASQSRIEDADFAAETGNLTKAQILSQAATAMLAQANASKQSVLSLLQG